MLPAQEEADSIRLDEEVLDFFSASAAVISAGSTRRCAPIWSEYQDPSADSGVRIQTNAPAVV
ncbi:hypothetical protein [Rhodopseudomonas parapalustris]